jgi:hypothetical protein
VSIIIFRICEQIVNNIGEKYFCTKSMEIFAHLCYNARCEMRLQRLFSYALWRFREIFVKKIILYLEENQK